MTLRRILILAVAAAMPAAAPAQAPAPAPGGTAPADVKATPVPPDPGSATVPTDGSGFRVGSLLGAAVWSSDNREIGKVADVLFAPRGGGEPTVVLSVGGFLGWGETLVSLPLSRLQRSERWVLPGVLPETARDLPAFRFE